MSYPFKKLLNTQRIQVNRQCELLGVGLKENQPHLNEPIVRKPLIIK